MIIHCLIYRFVEVRLKSNSDFNLLPKSNRSKGFFAFMELAAVNLELTSTVVPIITDSLWEITFAISKHGRQNADKIPQKMRIVQ